MNATAGDGTLTFTPAISGRREFVAFDESGSYSHPELIGEIANQNIHAEPTPDMIILAPSAYMEQARRVAALHEQVDNFRVLVLDHEKVFNEFSSGTHDAMAYRRLCKMFYDRGLSEDGHKLGYLLLFGGGSYDNRLVGTDAGILNFPGLLTWQSANGMNEDGSYTARGKQVVAKTPMGRFGDQSEVYGCIHYLLSDAASFVTGAIIPVDGGFSSFSGI
jgi:hypothetical protein